MKNKFNYLNKNFIVEIKKMKEIKAISTQITPL